MYRSLYDEVPSFSYMLECPSEMGFRGDLAEVLESLSDSDISSKEGVLNRMFMAPRVLRSALDFQAETKRGLRLVLGASSLLQEAYTKEDVTDSLDSYRNLLSEFGINPNLVGISQRLDHLSWNSYAPHRTERTAEKLSSKGSICLIALGHGGLGVGMDLYLRLLDKNPFTEYSFFPVRFSRNVCSDTVPDIHSRAITNHINSISEGKEIVIFDEDENSGNTLAIAQAAFDCKFPDKIISNLANYRTKNYDLKEKCKLENVL